MGEVLTLFSMIIIGLGAFFHTKYQSEANKTKSTELKIEIDRLIVIQEAMFKKIDAHGEDIRAIQTEKEQFLTSKDADDLYLRIKEFDRFEKHIDKRFDSMESSLGKILVKLDTI